MTAVRQWAGDAAAWLALHLLDGWLLGGGLAVWTLVVFRVGRRRGRLVQARAQVRAGVDRETARRVADLVPGQRDGTP